MTDRSRVNPNSTQFIPFLLWIYNIGSPSFFLLFRELQDSPDPEIRGKCQLFQGNPFFGAAVLSLYGRQTHRPHISEMFSFFFKLSRSWNPKANAGPKFSLNVVPRLFRSFYRMSDPRPVSCLLRSGTKRCSGEEIVFFFHQTSPPLLPINLVKRLELEDCLLLLAAAIPGYVLSNVGENLSHFFCPPALQLGFFSPLVGLYQIPVIFGRKEGNLSWRGPCTSKYRLPGKTATVIT